MWASQMLGMFYKMPAPPGTMEELDALLGPALVKRAVGQADPAALIVLQSLAALAPEPLGPLAADATRQLEAAGITTPKWAGQIGKAEFVEGVRVDDVFGDQIGYYATFRHDGAKRHLVTALYDFNLGGIIKDAFVGDIDEGELSELINLPKEGIIQAPADPSDMAGWVLDGISTGDMFLDNDWTDDFKQTRALLINRMSGLKPATIKNPKPISDAKRATLVRQFRASRHFTGHEQADEVIEYCIDFSHPDPLRWSPMVVEIFMVDFLPRKASFDLATVKVVPDILKDWVRFALGKKKLEQRWIDEVVDAIEYFAPEFRQNATDPSSFGPAKMIAHLMQGAGVKLTDPAAVQDWMDEFNNLPFEQRDQLFTNLPFSTP